MTNKHIVMLLFAILMLSSCRSRCNDIVDIYYSNLGGYDAYSLTCPYTKTPRGCEDCGNLYIKRTEYAAWDRGYKLKGVVIPPYMRNTEGREVFPPMNNGYLN